MARDVRERVGKVLVKFLSRRVPLEREMPRTLKRTRAWAYMDRFLCL
jgi:hypothetical protein